MLNSGVFSEVPDTIFRAPLLPLRDFDAHSLKSRKREPSLAFYLPSHNYKSCTYPISSIFATETVERYSLVYSQSLLDWIQQHTSRGALDFLTFGFSSPLPCSPLEISATKHGRITPLALSGATSPRSAASSVKEKSQSTMTNTSSSPPMQQDQKQQHIPHKAIPFSLTTTSKRRALKTKTSKDREKKDRQPKVKLTGTPIDEPAKDQEVLRLSTVHKTPNHVNSLRDLGE